MNGAELSFYLLLWSSFLFPGVLESSLERIKLEAAMYKCGIADGKGREECPGAEHLRNSLLRSLPTLQ